MLARMSVARDAPPSPVPPSPAAPPPPRFAPRRALGRTGFVATAFGVGDLADPALPFDDCLATLRRALDAGLNVIDTAPAYEDGLGERLVGAAVRERPRDQLFVIDKIDFLDRPVAPQVDGSLARLGLPHADLFVFHRLTTLGEWRALAAPGGGFDQLAACVHAGKVRFRGISCHDPEVLLPAVASGLCDVVMLPVGPFVDARYLDDVLPRARAAGLGTVSFKTFGAGMLVADTSGYGRPLPPRAPAPARPRLSVDECVAFTLACDPDVALLGLSTPAEQDAAFVAAQTALAAAPLPAERRRDIRQRAAAAIAGKGPCWWNP
jgi:aryl-alcohol dehydrogenase-like predicted oxidoreductase